VKDLPKRARVFHEEEFAASLERPVQVLEAQAENSGLFGHDAKSSWLLLDYLDGRKSED
jgi:hypothetical protein